MSDTTLPAEEIGETSVNRVIREFPETVQVFNRHGIDACCGGAAAVREAALRDGADPDQLTAELLAVLRAGR